MKHTFGISVNTTKALSKLKFLQIKFQITLFFAIIVVLSGVISISAQNFNSVDAAFNPQVSANSFGPKTIGKIQCLPNGKILISGNFNSYNRQTVMKLVRLNADATIDTAFNDNLSNLFPAGNLLTPTIQEDGKIIVLENLPSGAFVRMVRLNENGTLDSTFNFNVNSNGMSQVVIGTNGKLFIYGIFPQINKRIIRLNPDGSLDDSFQIEASPYSYRIAVQNNKLLVASYLTSQTKIDRFNEDGTIDSSFIPKFLIGVLANRFIIQPDSKILVLDEYYLRRLNENGSDDAGFVITQFPVRTREIGLANDGKITVAFGNGTTQIKRFLFNGLEDNSFTPYNTINYHTFGVQTDGSVIIGDYFNGGLFTTIPNNFSKLFPNGTLDPTFNVGGIGFQNASPGNVRSIAVQPDGKILISGKFDDINNSLRPKVARLNADSTIDTSFQLNTTGMGNSFSNISDIDNVAFQNNEKIIISGYFNYTVNGIEKRHLARLNSDGSIDTSFNFSLIVNTTFGGTGQGPNKPITFDDGKLLLGTSRLGLSGDAVPIKINSTGERDNSFNPNIYNTANSIYINDLAVQSNGKIIISGQYSISNTNKGYVARLNADGSTDQTFQIFEETNKSIKAVALLPNGKILVAKAGEPQSEVVRLNSDGSLDNSFNAGTGANDKINALLLLPDGKIFVGGKFTSFDGQPRQKLAYLNADGSLASNVYYFNDEILDLALDGNGRVLVGGSFTTINAGGGGANRSYIARLVDSTLANRTRFDFDGDGRADLGVFETANRTWSILNSQNNQTFSMPFGLSIDKIAPADFDGDGKTDIAVYRPSEGIWYLMRSRDGFTALRWGADEDKPIAGDFDGDGKADLAVWRPSTAVWYILQSSNSQAFIAKFGLPGDVPLPRADFDGDGKTDIAVWRPSEGNFYWLASGSANAFRAVHFGANGDIPAIGDFNGDGKTDLVVYRPAEGNWYQYLTAPDGQYAFAVTRFGLSDDVPVPADYDGDGKTDIAIRRGNTWHVLNSTQGYTSRNFGNANSQAVAALPIQ